MEQLGVSVDNLKRQKKSLRRYYDGKSQYSEVGWYIWMPMLEKNSAEQEC
jgi:hypothetical protein